MVADTYSARLGILKMGTGNQNNSWGDSFNASATDIIERALAGQVGHAVTGGTLDLSGSNPPAGPSQAIDLNHAFTGTLTANQIFVLPNNSALHLINNSTTGAFSLLVKTAAVASTVEIPQGTTKLIFVTINNNVVRIDSTDVGQLGHFANSAIPSGWMSCNGASLLRTDHPDLFAAISTTWGAVDGTHFTLPLLTDTGRFLRSSSGSLAVGTYQSNQNLAHTHTVTGAPSVGSLGTDNPGNHTHANSLTDLGHTHSYNAPLSFGASGSGAGINGSSQTLNTGSNNSTPMSITNVAAGAHTHNVTGTLTAGTLGTASSGGTEARPESAVVLICIKY